MSQHVMTNFVKTTLRAPILVTDTVLPLAAGAGLFFSIPAGDWCYLTVNDSTTAEVVKYTSAGLVVGDNITVQRGVDGTTPKAFPAGSCVTEGWNVAQVTDLVTNVFNSLISTIISPTNTIALTAAPVSAPPAGVIYAINVITGSLWYFSPPTWVKIQANAVLQVTSNPVAAPPDSVVWAVNLSSHGLFFWTGSTWISVGGGGASSCPQAFSQGCASISAVLGTGDWPFRTMAGVAWVTDISYIPPGAVSAMHIDSNGYFHFDHNCVARFSASFQGVTEAGKGVDCELSWTHTLNTSDNFGQTCMRQPLTSSLQTQVTNTTMPLSVGVGDLWDANLAVETGATLGNLIVNQVYRGVEIIALL